jgi:hypothetical protein
MPPLPVWPTDPAGWDTAPERADRHRPSFIIVFDGAEVNEVEHIPLFECERLP